MNSSDIRYEARQLLKNVVGTYKLFLIPILIGLTGMAPLIRLTITQQVTESSYLTNDATIRFNLSAELFPQVFSFIIGLFFISTSYTLLEVYRKERTQVDFKDSLRAFSSPYLVQIFLVSLAKGLLLLPWILLSILPTLIGFLILVGSDQQLNPDSLSLFFIPSIIGYVMLIIKGFAYSQANLILFDRINNSQPTHPFDVIKESVQLMKGYKADFFILGLSFFGWYVLIMMTLGLAAFYVLPYRQTADVIFYERLKLDRQTNQTPL